MQRSITVGLEESRQMKVTPQGYPALSRGDWKLLRANSSPVDSHILHELLKIAL